MGTLPSGTSGWYIGRMHDVATPPEVGIDPHVCVPPRMGVSLGFRLAHAIAKAGTRHAAISVATMLLASETHGPVAAWRRSSGVLILAAAEGLSPEDRRLLIGAASPWASTEDELAATFGSIARSHAPTLVDLEVAILLLAERCPEIEATRDEFAEALGALSETTAFLVDAEGGRDPVAPVAEVVALRRLTPRERQILELIAAGRGTRHIAEALVISPKTVKTHVQNILSKLGVGSRLEAAALLRDAVTSSVRDAVASPVRD